jgi:hypothetical protein
VKHEGEMIGAMTRHRHRIDISPIDAASNYAGRTLTYSWNQPQLGRHAAIVGRQADEVRRATQQAIELISALTFSQSEAPWKVENLSPSHSSSGTGEEIVVKRDYAPRKYCIKRFKLMDTLRPLGLADGQCDLKGQDQDSYSRRS